MVVSYPRFIKATAQAAILLTGLVVTACAPRSTAPVQLAASNPTVTYQYRNDAELLQANQNAAGFCTQYQAIPRQVRFEQGPNNSRVVIFECIQGVPVALAGPAVIAVAYDGFYDDYYGPFYDGYWGPDGYFYFSEGAGRPFHRDDFHHFRREAAVGFHGVRGSGVHPG